MLACHASHGWLPSLMKAGQLKATCNLMSELATCVLGA